MSVKECVKMLEECGSIEPGRVQKLAAAAFKMEVGERALHPVEAVKEMLGIKKPIHQRIMQYIAEGVEQAKPRIGFAVAGIGAAAGIGLLSKAYAEVKFRSAMDEMMKDPEIQTDPYRAESIARMVKRWAPAIAADPEVLKGTVKNLMKFPDSYLTYDIASKLSDAQKRFAATHGLFAMLKERVL